MDNNITEPKERTIKVSDSDDDSPLYSLRECAVPASENEPEDENEHSHLDCLDTSISDDEKSKPDKEPVSPIERNQRGLQRPLPNNSSTGKPAEENLLIRPAVKVDLSERALARPIL